MLKKILGLGFLLSGSIIANAQQYAQYSQYMFNRQYINPAYAGSNEALNLNTYYRSQWTDIKGAPKTLGVSADMPLNNDNVGVGVSVIKDKIGLENRLYTYFNYAYRLRLGSDPAERLSLGVSAGFIHNSYNNEDIITTDPEDIFIDKSTLPDARLGVYYTNNRFFAGFSVDNLLAKMIYNKNGNKNVIPPVVQMYANAGGLFYASEGIAIKPSFLLKNATLADTRAWTLDLSTSVVFDNRFSVGAAYRTALSSGSTMSPKLTRPNAIIGLLEIAVSESFKFSYSYDYMLGNIQTYTGSSHEISLSYRLPRMNNNRMRTPRFF